MDAIPLSLLLIPYFFVVGVAAIFLFFNVFHLWRYGLEGTGTSLLILVYLGLFVLVVGGTWAALSGFAWHESFSLNDILPATARSSSFGL